MSEQQEETRLEINRTYLRDEPTRDAVDALPGATLLEFGTEWCGYCMAAQPLLVEALAAVPGVRHLKVEDGAGRPLGRSYRIKLWPALIFLKDGVEQARLIRPQGPSEIRDALRRIL